MRFEAAWVNSDSAFSPWLMSTGTDIVESLTVACREEGKLGDGPRHPRRNGIKIMKLQK